MNALFKILSVSARLRICVFVYVLLAPIMLTGFNCVFISEDSAGAVHLV